MDSTQLLDLNQQIEIATANAIRTLVPRKYRRPRGISKCRVPTAIPGVLTTVMHALSGTNSANVNTKSKDCN